MIYLLCAGSRAEARQWARNHGIRRRQIIYASRIGTVLGLRNFVTVRLPSHFGRRDWAQIDAAIRLNEAKMAVNPSARAWTADGSAEG